MKVVSVTRKPESEEVVRKKGKDGKNRNSSFMSTFFKELYADILPWIRLVYRVYVKKGNMSLYEKICVKCCVCDFCKAHPSIN